MHVRSLPVELVRCAGLESRVLLGFLAFVIIDQRVLVLLRSSDANVQVRKAVQCTGEMLIASADDGMNRVLHCVDLSPRERERRISQSRGRQAD